MTRRLPLLILAGVLACRPAPAPPAHPVSTPVAAAPTGPFPCTPDQLTAEVTGGDAAMSHRSMTISTRNRSTVTCTVTGYPALRFVDSLTALIAQLSPRHGASSYFAPESAGAILTLAPGDSAWFEISYLGAPVGPPCYSVATLGISPTRDSSTIMMPFGDLVCEDSVDVSPFRRSPPPT